MRQLTPKVRPLCPRVRLPCLWSAPQRLAARPRDLPARLPSHGESLGHGWTLLQHSQLSFTCVRPIPGSPAGPGTLRTPPAKIPNPSLIPALPSAAPFPLHYGPPHPIPQIPQQTNPLGRLEKHKRPAPQSSQVHRRKSFWGPCSAFHPIGMARTHLPPRPRSADAPAGPRPESHLCSVAAAPAPRAPARRFGLTASPSGTEAARSAPWPGPRCCSRRSPAPLAGPAPGASEPRPPEPRSPGPGSRLADCCAPNTAPIALTYRRKPHACPEH